MSRFICINQLHAEIYQKEGNDGYNPLQSKTKAYELTPHLAWCVTHRYSDKLPTSKTKLCAAVLAGNDTFLTENITEDTEIEKNS